MSLELWTRSSEFCWKRQLPIGRYLGSRYVPQSTSPRQPCKRCRQSGQKKPVACVRRVDKPPVILCRGPAHSVLYHRQGASACNPRHTTSKYHKRCTFSALLLRPLILSSCVRLLSIWRYNASYRRGTPTPENSIFDTASRDR